MNMSTTPPGEVLIEGDRATLLFKRTLAHAPEAVWAALTDPAQLKQWFMTSATIDARRGGSVDMVSGPSRFHWQGAILVWDPPRVYEYEWNLDPRPEVPQGERSIVRWELTPAGKGTLLTLQHRNLTKPTAIGFAPGTHAFLDRLAALLEHAALPDWMARYKDVQSHYPTWDRSAAR